MNYITIIISTLILLSALSTKAQEDTVTNEHTPDTTYIDLKNKRIIIIDKVGGSFDDFGDKEEDIREEKKHETKDFDSHFGGIELGLNTYMTPDQSLTLGEEQYYMELEDSRSLEFNLNLFDVAIPIIDERVGLVSGLGFSWQNYKFDNKQLVLQNDSSVLYYDSVSSKSYKKNKLTTVFLTAPLALEFQFPAGRKDVWFLIGGYAGVKIGSYVKLVADDDDKSKTKEDFHLNTFRYGLRAAVGVNSWSIYATYSAKPLFKKDEGPELYPISVGVGLAF
ncbi:MAG TPA: outer membrane beta-barrel protein [Salinivirga sp.]|uniref:outer membrane beta-barrel protein n=1 Tax=Salinivirga sp. TaxID=1970192 RepID=UPI002B45F873|nr:outer membrane beta-barrel protein [Salinivirga sp.]HKK58223.1 outer membrane beta-barrel protein [Salinivirga sp.]